MRTLFLLFYYSIISPLPRQFGGGLLRNLVGRLILDSMAPGSSIRENVHIGKGKGLSLNENSYIGRNTFLALDEKITIGKNVMIGPQVMIFTANHGLHKNLPMIQQPTTKAPVTIEDDVWVGARAILLPGVHLGKGCVIGAGAIVSRSVEPYAIVGGIPARHIRYRQ